MGRGDAARRTSSPNGLQRDAKLESPAVSAGLPPQRLLRPGRGLNIILPPADADILGDHLTIAEDLQLDQVDLTLLIATLESQLDVYLSTEEVARIETLADVNHYFAKHAITRTSSSAVGG